MRLITTTAVVLDYVSVLSGVGVVAPEYGVNHLDFGRVDVATSRQNPSRDDAGRAVQSPLTLDHHGPVLVVCLQDQRYQVF